MHFKTLKNVRYSKQKSKSRSETLILLSSVSYETKLKFVEIVMISVSDLAPALAILGVIIFQYLQRVRFGKKSIIYVGYVYNKNIKIITLIIVLPGSTRL